MEKIYVEEGESEEQALEAIMGSMGWKPKVAERLRKLDKPGQRRS